MKCSEYELKIKEIKKQNEILEKAKERVKLLLKDLDYTPFATGWYPDKNTPLFVVIRSIDLF